jgi:hypothetical protein
MRISFYAWVSWCAHTKTRRHYFLVSAGADTQNYDGYTKMGTHTEKKGSMGKQLGEPPVYIVLSTISAEGAFVLTD